MSKPQQKVLITGVNGMLGSAIYRCFDASGSFECYGTGRSEESIHAELKNYFSGDLTDGEFVEALAVNSPVDVVIHCAAIVNLSTCETNPALAEEVHVRATAKLAKAFGGSRFNYISTDSVFDGIDGGYSEEDIADPLNTYARTKYEGERAAIVNNPNTYIARTNIYGFKQPMGGSIFEWAYKELSAGNEISGFLNFIFNPLYVGQLAGILLELINSQAPFGTYHLGSTESISKYGFLVKVAETFGFNKDLIKEVKSNPASGALKRPEITTLSIEKITRVLDPTLFGLDRGFGMLKKDFLDA